VDRHKGREVLRLREEVLPLVRLRSVMNNREAGVESAAVIAELGQRRTALAVDELIGREQILVKQFDGAVGTLPIFSGVTLLADGRPALVLDPISVV
jgi:two-component system, chemotaxis family, sensor kinase CheA